MKPPKTITKKNFERMLEPVGAGVWVDKKYILNECPFCMENYSMQFEGAIGVWRCVSCGEFGTSFGELEHKLDIRFVPIDEKLAGLETPDGLIVLGDYNAPKEFTTIDSGIEDLDKILGGFTEGALTVLSGKQGEGKCYGFGTKLIMADGRMKEVQDISVGDKLLGPDSTPRTVTRLSRGTGELYRVDQRKGMSYIVNGQHVLCLKEKRREIEMPVTEFMSQNATRKGRLYGYRVGVEYPEQNVPVDPYFLGIWLGDGNHDSQAVTTPDLEVIESMAKYTELLGQRMSVVLDNKTAQRYRICRPNGTRADSPDLLRNIMQSMGLFEGKHIPDVYLHNSRRVRLELLAGIVDSDGFLNHNCYEIVQKRKDLSDQIQYLANSLGYRCRFKECRKKCHNNGKVGTYYRTNISGNVQEIPCRVERRRIKKFNKSCDPTATGITVTPIGIGNYYGFETDGDHKHLLEDFTVSHNSTLAGQLALNAIQQGKSVCFYSGELSTWGFSRWIYSQAAGPDYCKGYRDKYGVVRYEADRDLVPTIKEWIGKKLLLYDNSALGSSETQSIIKRFKEARQYFGAEMFFVDNLMTVRQNAASSDSNMLAQSRFVGDLIDLAQQHKSHVVLVAHPRKGDDGDYNERVAGIGDITRRSSNVLFLERLEQEQRDKLLMKREIISPTTTNILHVSKNRMYGDMGDIELTFDKRSRRLLPSLDPQIVNYGWMDLQ